MVLRAPSLRRPKEQSTFSFSFPPFLPTTNFSSPVAMGNHSSSLRQTWTTSLIFVCEAKPNQHTVLFYKQTLLTQCNIYIKSYGRWTPSKCFFFFVPVFERKKSKKDLAGMLFAVFKWSREVCPKLELNLLPGSDNISARHFKSLHRV